MTTQPAKAHAMASRDDATHVCCISAARHLPPASAQQRVADPGGAVP
eukprot:CAMPEP_0174749334 /NCGR_PEP_ID=MMETSP1094-20130205/95482_1 /TAXON_ID=156173 /ORGANISM="Chrysochromulina brevifilum, Strain UTEX LB 985" /LENGTH=46 /DNA_ID= /DNA_START= /DNA_END= /DNA_ORIENTATION=